MLALPKLVTVYATSMNHMMPGDNFTFFPSMGAYDIHTVITDGKNNWTNTGEATWGLTKYGVGYAVSIAAGAGASGAIATAATAFVTGLLATVVAPPVLPFIAFGTFWGTAVLSSMTVYAMTDKAMDLVKGEIAGLVQNETRDGRDAKVLGELTGIYDLPHDHPDHLFLFDNVVTEEPIRAAFAMAYSGVNTSRLVITRRQAEAYFSGMLSDFTQWKHIRGYNQAFIITGGFTPPKILPGTTWKKTTFEPFAMGEILRENPGLCQKSLVIEFRDGEGVVEGRARVQSDWDAVPVAEKTLKGDQQTDQECRKRYVAMCELSSLRVLTECRLSAFLEVDEPVWEEVEKDDRSLGNWLWSSRSITLQEGERGLRLLTAGVTSGIERFDAPSKEIGGLTKLTLWAEDPSDE